MSRFLQRTLFAMLGLQLALTEVATLFEMPIRDFRWPLSLNSLLVVIITILAVLIVLMQRKPIACITVVALSISAILILMLTSPDKINHVQYLLLACSGLSVSLIRLDTASITFARRALLAGAAAVVFQMVLQIALGENWITRGGSMAGVVAMAVLLGFSTGAPRIGRTTALAAGVLVILIYNTSTARMGSLTATVLVVLALLILTPKQTVIRVSAVFVVLLANVLFWTLTPLARQRMFGGDSALKAGPVTVNSTGRAEAFELLEENRDPTGVWELALGHGPGTSGSVLVANGYVLDTPHNEFIRLFVDFGVFGITIFVALLALLLMWSRTLMIAQLPADSFLVLAVAVILGMFALTDNPLSYSWVYLPLAGVLSVVASSRRMLDQRVSWTRLGAN